MSFWTVAIDSRLDVPGSLHSIGPSGTIEDAVSIHVGSLYKIGHFEKKNIFKKLSFNWNVCGCMPWNLIKN